MCRGFFDFLAFFFFGLFWPHGGLRVHLRARGFPSQLATPLFHFLSALWALGDSSGSSEIGEVILGWVKHLSVQLPPPEAGPLSPQSTLDASPMR